MENNDEGFSRPSVVERHIQTIITAVLLALVLWTGSTLVDIKTEVTTLKVQVATMQGEIRAGTDDRFRGTDWRREKEVINDRFQRIEAELEWNRTHHDETNRFRNNTPPR